MARVEPGRLALFLAVSAVLVVSAVLFARGGSDAAPPAPAERGARAVAEEVPRWAEETRRWAVARQRELERVARRFLEAFGHYEVGEVSRRVKRDVRATSTPGFAAALLGAPPAPPPLGGFLGESRVARMDVTFLAADATRALVSGDLKRGRVPEEFGFLFVRRGGRWQASGPGQ